MRFQNCTNFIAGVLSASCVCFVAIEPQAKDWDLDRGQYKRDSDISDCAGPVRKITSSTYEGNKLASLHRVFFDADGNLVRSEYYNYKDNYCAETTYGRDDRGNRTNEISKSGQILALGATNSCRDLTLQWSWKYTYDFDARGAVVVRRISNAMMPVETVGQTWRYAYDSLGQLTLINVSGGGFLDQRSETYTYSSDSRGLRVKRHHVSSWNDGKITNDVVREALYAPDGRLLEVVQAPAGVIDFLGNEVRSYSAAGQLIQQRLLDFNRTTTFSRHDNHGNWTESVDSRGERVIRQIEY
jgi:hypothetical protein